MPSLNWIGKSAVVKHHKDVPYRLLEPVPELSCGDPDSGNLIVQGDNLHALKALLPRYAGQVKCIYIDPPYNTGNEGWVYNDNVNSPEIRKWLGEVVGKEGETLDRHDRWLCMMYPRLVLLRQFLRDDGVIFISIDDSEGAYLQILMDEVFGRQNHIATIAVKMSELSGVKMNHADKKPPKLKEQVVIYGERNSALRPLVRKKAPESLTKYLKYYTKVIENPSDPVSQWRLRKIKDVLAEEGIEPTLVAIRDFRIREAHRVVYRTNNSLLASLEFKTKTAPVTSPTGIEYVWWEGKEMLFLKDYMEEALGDFWPDISTINLNKEGSVKFQNGKKPEALLERIIEMSTSPGDIVLDSFLGSGSTAAVAMKLGRKFIGVEIGAHARTHCVPRLSAVVAGEQGGISKRVGWQGGSGFQFCKLSKEPLFAADGQIRENVTFAQLAEFVWFSETGTGYKPTRKKSPLLGIHEGRAIYLLYNGILDDLAIDSGNVLTGVVLDKLPKHDGPRVIYAAACRLGTPRLNREGIVFKQTPYALDVSP
ncbi:site-specific DNA-methyltransferase [Thermomonas sp.]|uniref:site-specific DNA-methyltransferase n=1 Tax=Thermomonas sp. TaxID=1971895 RepID=UPI0035B32EDB